MVLPRSPKTDARCDRVTDLMRHHERVPERARFRASWRILINVRTMRRAEFLMTEQAARRFCQVQLIPFPDPSMPALVPPPESCAHDPDHGVERVADRRALTRIDTKARAAGEEP